jgi:hypothetical protein
LRALSATRKLHRRPSPEGEGLAAMTDLLIVALTVGLFAAAEGFVLLCERM